MSIQKHIRISEELHQIILDYKKLNNIPTFSMALEQMCMSDDKETLENRISKLENILKEKSYGY